MNKKSEIESAGTDVAARLQAERFQRVREAHQTELAEDYVELIADLIDTLGEARVVDLATRLGVSSATVNNALQRLQRDGLVSMKPYRSIFLTQEGHELAIAARQRHSVVREFLISLGVDAATADSDAEGIEHHVSAASLDAFRAHLRRHKKGR